MKKAVILVVISFFWGVSGFAGKIDTLQIYSPEMEKEIPVVVVVPKDYDVLEISYPVVYLLHGYSGNHLTWVSNFPRLKDYVDDYQVIAVMPDGGYDSWYLDSPVDEQLRYESFITKTLIPEIDALYHTLPQREKRGITGLSMGGHGALYLAIQHPELFGAAASMSGGVDILPFPDNWGIKKSLGNQENYPDNWKNHSVLYLIEKLKPGAVKLFIDEGIDDIFIEENRALHQKLLDLEIPHDYIERPGAHTREYWDKVLPYHFLFFREYFYY